MSNYHPAPIPAELVTVIAMQNPDDAVRMIETFQFAAAAHAGQQRDEGTPFIDHPVAVTAILWHELGCRDVDVILASLTHDILEDCTWIDASVLSDLIGSRAVEFVQHVTKPPVSDAEKPERDRMYLESLRSLPPESRLLKLADRIHNLRMVVHSGDRPKSERYLYVSRHEFVPLALTTDPAAARLIADACDAIEVFLANESSCS